MRIESGINLARDLCDSAEARLQAVGSKVTNDITNGFAAARLSPRPGPPESDEDNQRRGRDDAEGNRTCLALSAAGARKAAGRDVRRLRHRLWR